MKDMPACPGCRHEWTGAAPAGARVIRDLKVKGSSLVVKRAAMVNNIRLVDGDHDIGCKTDAIGALGLK